MKNNNDDFIMLPTVDFCFKELMQNPKVRQGFIAALLGKKPDEIQETSLLPTFLHRESPSDKLGILDVRVLMKDGTQLDLEMQVAYFAYWEKRILFYLGKIYTGQLREGEPYDNLQKCIHVSILDFIHFPDDTECYRTIHLRDNKTGKIYTDLLEIQILELKKLPQNVQSGDDIIDWMQFFSGKSRKEFSEMAKTNEYLDEAYNTLLNLSADEQKRLEYEAREKALRDYNSQMSSAKKYGLEQGLKQGLEQGLKQGLEQGLEQGRQQGLEISRQIFKLYMQGKQPEEIAELCSLPLEQIQEILF